MLDTIPPNPGSKKATDEGCLCPVMDNHYGKGREVKGEGNSWWIDIDCPMHGVTTKENK